LCRCSVPNLRVPLRCIQRNLRGSRVSDLRVPLRCIQRNLRGRSVPNLRISVRLFQCNLRRSRVSDMRVSLWRIQRNMFVISSLSCSLLIHIGAGVEVCTPIAKMNVYTTISLEMRFSSEGLASILLLTILYGMSQNLLSHYKSMLDWKLILC